MRIDFYFGGDAAGPRLTGSVRLVEGRAVAQDDATARFMRISGGWCSRGGRSVADPEDGLEYMRAIPFNLRGSYSWAEWNHEGLDDEALEESFARLRRPESTSTVEGSLPVLFFGDFLTSHAVTVALNPSDREYVDKEGSLLYRPRAAIRSSWHIWTRVS